MPRADPLREGRTDPFGDRVRDQRGASVRQVRRDRQPPVVRRQQGSGPATSRRVRAWRRASRRGVRPTLLPPAGQHRQPLVVSVHPVQPMPRFEEARPGREVGGLAPDLHEPLHRGDRREDDHHPEDGHENVEGEADAEQHHPLGAFHEAAAGVVAEPLGPGPLVRDRASSNAAAANARSGRYRALTGEVPGDSTEDDGIRHAVGDGVEERAAWAGLPAAPGDGTVEEVDEATRRRDRARPTAAGRRR